MQYRKIIAREWLILVLFFFVSPVLLATYQWVSAPKIVTIQKVEGKNTFDWLRGPDNYPWGIYDPVDDESEFRQSTSWTYKKKSFWSYLVYTVKDADSYLAIILTYPLYLFMRSILWSVRTLRRVAS